MGHRLNFTAEDLLDAIQQTSRCCTEVLNRTQCLPDPESDDVKNVIAAQERIEDAAQALRERMPFAPL